MMSAKPLISLPSEMLVSGKETVSITGVDLETTGLKQEDGDRIVEIAMIEVLYETRSGKGYIKRKFVQRVNPQRPIHPDAEAIHGISMAMLRDEPVWEEVVHKVIDFLHGTDLLVAHNMNFDGPFLAGEIMRVGFRPPEMPTLCTMQQARWATPMGKLPKLSELCFALGVDYDTEEAHAAEYDVRQTLKCLMRGLKSGYYQFPEGVL